MPTVGGGQSPQRSRTVTLLSATEIGPLGLTETEIRAAYIPNIEDVTTSVAITRFPNGKGWKITGESTQENASDIDLVARFERTIGVNEHGTIIINHIDIKVEPLYQHQGYAKALLRENMPLYQRIGAEFIELTAVGDGTLVWPRYGWSLHGPSIPEVQQELMYAYAGRYKVHPPDEIQIPVFGPDLLMYEDDEGWRIGFHVLSSLALSSRELRMRLHLK
jgi:GNAT superfamily N-acetyltransferase